jgi:RNA polymerase sigma-70 factor (sigma-E family)
MTFEEFTQTRLPAVLSFATVLAGQRATAEDLAQEVLIKAHARWDTIGKLDRPEMYVRKMVLNEFLSWRRRSWRLIPAGDTDLGSAQEPDHAVGYAEHSAMLTEIARLPRRQRAVLVLRYYEDRSDTEIAELLGCAPGSVRAYASRALATLRVELRPTPRDPTGLADSFKGKSDAYGKRHPSRAAHAGRRRTRRGRRPVRTAGRDTAGRRHAPTQATWPPSAAPCSRRGSYRGDCRRRNLRRDRNGQPADRHAQSPRRGPEH